MISTLELTRTNPAHLGDAQLVSMMRRPSFPVAQGQHIDITVGAEPRKSQFQTYMLEAVNTLNEQQNDVSRVQKQLIIDPDSVDIHDVTISMAKAQMSLSLAQTVIDRLVKGWNEISTTR